MVGSLRKRGLARRQGAQVVGFRRWQQRRSALAATLCARIHSEAADLQAHSRLRISLVVACEEQTNAKNRAKDVQVARFATRLLRNFRGFLPGLLDLLLSFFLQPYFPLGVFLATDAVVSDRQLVMPGGVFRLLFYARLQRWDGFCVPGHGIKSKTKAKKSVCEACV